MLAELHAQFAQVAWADANVLEHLGVVVGDLPAAHGRPHVVVGNPHFVSDQPGPNEVSLHQRGICRLLGSGQQPLPGFFGDAFAASGKHLLDQVGRRQFAVASLDRRLRLVARGHCVEPPPRQTFDGLDAPGHIIAQVLRGLVRKDLAQVRSRHPPALSAGSLSLAANQLDQVVLANFVDVHEAKHASV
ncbi:hypothetical protein D3C81_1067230 [compost metagenome]